MDWFCPEDRSALTAREDRLSCPECGHEYDLVDGIPLFTHDDRRRAHVERSTPLLEELWRSMQERPAAEAAARFCERHGCARSPYNADWKFFFSVPQDGRAVEFGAGFGDDSLDLAGGPGGTVSVVPSLLNARIVLRHLGERASVEWPVIVMSDLSRLPFADSSIQAVALEDAAAGGFALSDAGFSRIAAEWNRILAPGGVVFLGLANGMHRLPGVAQVRSAVSAHARPESFNRMIKRSAATGHGRLSVGRTVRAMARLGFSAPVVYAPIPDENDTQVVIPVDDVEVVRYFLNNLIRKNSRTVRLAVRGASLLVTLGLFRRLVPYYYLIFRKGEPGKH